MGYKCPEARRRHHAEYMRRRYAEDAEFREKQKSRVKVSRAVRNGRLVKGPCENCGSPETEAHHDDYGRPLDVRWMCRGCHENEHGGPGCHGVKPT